LLCVIIHSIYFSSFQPSLKPNQSKNVIWWAWARKNILKHILITSSKYSLTKLKAPPPPSPNKHWVVCVCVGGGELSILNLYYVTNLEIDKVIHPWYHLTNLERVDVNSSCMLFTYIRCRNLNLAKCGGEAQHLEKLGIWSPPGLPNV